MSKKTMRLWSLLLVFVMIFNLLPLHAMAEEIDVNQNSSSAETQESRSDHDLIDDVYIIEELIENRTEYSKEFVMSNGLHMAAVYGNAVHFHEDGQWKEIDNTLKLATTRSGNVYTNTAGSWQVAFPQSLTENNGITISKNQYSISFRMSGELHEAPGGTMAMDADANATLATENEASIINAIGSEEHLSLLPPAESADAVIQTAEHTDMYADVQYSETVLNNLYSKIEYADVYDNTDIIYEINSNAVKESVVINQFEATLYGYTYLLDVGEMRPVLTDSGEIQLYDADLEKMVMIMPAPYLVDNAGEYNYDVQIMLDEMDGTYILAYLLPQEWLADDDREWPVILDPEVKFIASNTNAEDQNVYENTNISTSHTANTVTCGYEASCRTMRFFMKYNELPEIASADVIVSATITLYMTSHAGVAVPIEIHDVTEEWSASTLTWNNQPDFNEDLIEDYAVCNYGQRYYRWDITDLVRQWYSGDNKGMVFKASDAVEAAKINNWKRFYSADFKTAEQPTLMITFRNNNGLESSWDYSSASAGRAGTVSVNNYTGNLVVSRSDIGYGGNRMPVSIGFTYNANDHATNIGYGFGWRMNYAQTIEPFMTDVDQYYCWTDGDGTRIYFYYSSEFQQWMDENGRHYTLTIGEDTFTIKDRDNNSLIFDADGRLTDIVDGKIEGNAIVIHYSNTKIDYVLDGVGRKYDLDYSENGNLRTISYIVKINEEDTLVETVNYTYTPDGNLDTVTYAGSLSASYNYTSFDENQTFYLTKATGSQEENVNITYAGDHVKKAKKVTVKDDDTLISEATFTYGKNYTTVTDNNERWVTYQFNNFGNTVAVYNKQGQAVYGAYSSPTQLVSSSRLQDTVTNLLTTREKTGSWSQSISVTGGKPYTLSGTGVGTGSKTLSIKANGITYTSYSVTTERAEVTVTVPSNVSTVTISGIGDFTDLQFEQTEAASRYNMLLDSDMSSVTHWSGVGTASTDGKTTLDTTDRANLDHNSLSITGEPTAEKQFTQTLTVEGTAADKYSFGLWVRADSVSLTNERDYEITGHHRRFGVEVRLLNGSTVVAEAYVAANDACSQWQFISGSLQATGAYNKVEFSLVYDYNANKAYFDGAQLFLENFAYRYEYDELGRVETVTDLEGNVISYEYRGESSDVTKITYPKVEGINNSPVYSYTYDSQNLLTGMTSPTGIQTSIEYDEYGNNKKTVISCENSALGNMQSNQTYTDDGNFPVTVTGTDRNTVTYNYNEENSTLASFRDAEGNLTSHEYDAMRRLVKTTSGSAQVSYQYSGDRLLSSHHTGGANGTTYRFTYTTGGLTDTITIRNGNAGGWTLVDNTYDEQKWTLTSQTYDNGDAWHYEYSEFDDLVRAYTTGGTSGTELRYFYNSEGALVRIEQYATIASSGNIILHGNMITTHTLVSTEWYYYDSANRATRIVRKDADGDSYECRWEYDHNNNVTNLVEVVNGQTHTTAYTYDWEQRISQLTTDGITSSYTYDGLGRLSAQTVQNGILNKGYTFCTVKREEVQEDGNTVEVNYATAQVHNLTLDAAHYDRLYTYSYDANGNITKVIVKNTATNTSTVTEYFYDALNQLVRENNQAAGKTWVYSYDSGGNITSKKEYAYTTDKVLSGNAVTVNYTYGNTHWGDLLTAYNGVGITCDEIGNPLNDGIWTYTWENGRQLASMTSGATTWSYKYNADGLRTERSNGTVTYDYIYSGSTLVQMTVGSDVLYFTYDASGTPLAVTFNGTKYFYATNLQGDVIAILDTAGNAVVEYTYDAWGNVLNATNSTLGNLNPLRYRGYVYDTETTLYYLQSRYYDPELGRFINTDAYASTGQGVLGNNMFAYCSNNPVNHHDPNGNVPLPILGLADYYLIHKMVQCLIVDSHGYAMEVYVTSPFGNGRLDLFDAANNQYYEVKHAPLASSWANSMQQFKYDHCKIGGFMFRGYTFAASPTAGSRVDITGTFKYDYWDITYKSHGNGLITYEARLNKARYFDYLETTLNAVAFAAVGAVCGYFYGTATRPGAGRYLYNDFKSD